MENTSERSERNEIWRHMPGVDDTIELHGYTHSVYSWIARLALRERGVEYHWREVNPFEAELPADFLAENPFGRVPMLRHGDFVLYETHAIVHYIDKAFAGSPLQPASAKGQARALQIVSIIDQHAYWPLVRQVFSHDVWRPAHGEDASPSEVETGLASASRVLGALEQLVGPGDYLVGDRLTTADLHLAPILAYFTLSERGRTRLQDHPRLELWWSRLARRASLRETDPFADGLDTRRPAFQPAAP